MPVLFGFAMYVYSLRGLKTIANFPWSSTGLQVDPRP